MDRYAVVGGTLWGNRGAEAMVVTAISRIRGWDADASFLLMSYFADHDRTLIDDPAVRVLDASPRHVALLHLPFAVLCWLLGLLRIRVPDVLLPRALRELRSCRALIDVTGISFHDGRLAVVAYNVMCLWPGILLGVPVVRLSQAMGPFRNPLNRLPSRWITKASFHTFARGRLTADYMRGLGVPERTWSIAADVAFAYRSGDSLTTENEDRVETVSAKLADVRSSGSDVVALVPSSLLMKKTIEDGDPLGYVQLLCDVVRDLNARGCHVLLLPNATRAGLDTLRNNDIVVIERVRDELRNVDSGESAVGLTCVDFDLNTESIRSLIAQCEATITSRFHAMVASLALGVPTLVMGWSHKYHEVLEMFDCDAWAVDFSEADSSLLPLIHKLLDEADEVRLTIQRSLPDVIASAESQFELLERLPPR